MIFILLLEQQEPQQQLLLEELPMIEPTYLIKSGLELEIQLRLMPQLTLNSKMVVYLIQSLLKFRPFQFHLKLFWVYLDLFFLRLRRLILFSLSFSLLVPSLLWALARSQFLQKLLSGYHLTLCETLLLHRRFLFNPFRLKWSHKQFLFSFVHDFLDLHFHLPWPSKADYLFCLCEYPQ